MIARILVADDNDEIRNLLKDFLEARSHEVLEAKDGAQAFLLAAKELPHLIIMDIMMPGVYGSTASKQLQDDPRLAKIPIIIISGTTDEPAKPLVARSPHIRFIPKPLDLGLLGKTIAELLPHGGYVP